jgi:predicted PurR-regulated permease PerM
VLDLTPKKISYIMFALVVIGIPLLHMGPVVLAGLFSFMILDLTHRAVSKGVRKFFARWLSVGVFLVTAAGLSWLVTVYFKLILNRIPQILAVVVPQIDGLAAQYGVDLPFGTLEELRPAIVNAMLDNARAITQQSGLLTKGFFQIVIGVFVAILFFLTDHNPVYGTTPLDAVRREFDHRVAIFMLGFEKILGAQVLISLINTCVTGVYLIAVDLPYVHFLMMSTFIFGVIPIIGNIISNSIIIGTALTISPKLAALSLIFLIVSHKAEYFFNSRIMGSRINTPMWQMLLGLLIGEAVMGVPGMVLAPALIHYIREELNASVSYNNGAPPRAARAPVK